MYHAGLLALFVTLAAYKPHRNVWVVVAFVTATVLCSRLAFGHNDAELYVIRSTAALLGGIALCKVGSRLALYHAGVYAVTLFAYLALAVDVALGRHFLIYNYYEAFIYGLVACQLLGVFPTVRACLVFRGPIRPPSVGHIQGGVEK